MAKWVVNALNKQLALNSFAESTVWRVGERWLIRQPLAFVFEAKLERYVALADEGSTLFVILLKFLEVLNSHKELSKHCVRQSMLIKIVHFRNGDLLIHQAPLSRVKFSNRLVLIFNLAVLSRNFFTLIIELAHIQFYDENLLILNYWEILRVHKLHANFALDSLTRHLLGLDKLFLLCFTLLDH